MKTCYSLLVAGLTLLFGSVQAAQQSNWTSMFNGKDLSGWKSNEEKPNVFTVSDGELKVSGGRAHLFYVGTDGKAKFKNFEFKAKVKTTPGANSGIYFHTEFQEKGWPAKGFEAQVNTTSNDRKKTGGLYAVSNADHFLDGYGCGVDGSGGGELLHGGSYNDGNGSPLGTPLSSAPVDPDLLLRLYAPGPNRMDLGCRADHGVALGLLQPALRAGEIPSGGGPGIRLTTDRADLQAFAAYRYQPGIACPPPIRR